MDALNVVNAFPGLRDPLLDLQHYVGVVQRL